MEKFFQPSNSLDLPGYSLIVQQFWHLVVKLIIPPDGFTCCFPSTHLIWDLAIHTILYQCLCILIIRDKDQVVEFLSERKYIFRMLILLIHHSRKFAPIYTSTMTKNSSSRHPNNVYYQTCSFFFNLYISGAVHPLKAFFFFPFSFFWFFILFGHLEPNPHLYPIFRNVLVFFVCACKSFCLWRKLVLYRHLHWKHFSILSFIVYTLWLFSTLRH